MRFQNIQRVAKHVHVQARTWIMYEKYKQILLAR